MQGSPVQGELSAQLTEGLQDGIFAKISIENLIPGAVLQPLRPSRATSSCTGEALNLK